MDLVIIIVSVVVIGLLCVIADILSDIHREIRAIKRLTVKRCGMAGYTDYCTCFYESKENKVYFYDEIKDRVIRRRKVKDKAEAENVMKAWVDNAPAGVICQCLDKI